MPSSVSVVTPCFNGSGFLRETLESALGQTHRPLEVIVVDDGSTDDSATIAQSFGPPVRVIRQENRGESSARNRGIAEARGEWVAFLDADDLWLPQLLEEQQRAATPGCVAVHTGTYLFGDASGVLDHSAVPPEIRYGLEYVALYTPIHISSLSVRADVCPRFPEHTRHGEDLLFQLELVRRGPIAYVPDRLCGYRRHGTSQSARRASAECRWFESVEGWLRENRGSIEPATAEAIHREWVLRLRRRVTNAKWRRKWDDYWTLRRFMERNLRDEPELASVLGERILPKWFYRVYDSVDRRSRRTEGTSPAGVEQCSGGEERPFGH